MYFFNIIYKAVSVMMIVVISVSGPCRLRLEKNKFCHTGKLNTSGTDKVNYGCTCKCKTNEITIEGVLSSLDKDAKKMRFVENSSGIEYEVPYTGGTDIQTKYGTR